MRGVILTSAGIIIGAEDLSVLYDEKGEDTCYLQCLFFSILAMGTKFSRV